MMVTNPFDITVTVAGAVSDVGWELDDGTGQKLASCSAGDCDPHWSAGGNSTSSETFHIKGFVLARPKSANGFLKLSPSRQDLQGRPLGLPELAIPVRLGTAASTLMVLVPKDYGQYEAEAGDACSTGPSSRYFPTTAFVRKSLTVMHVEDTIFASAEAAAESLPTQGPIHILNFAIQGGTAYVDVQVGAGAGWAGISIAICEVKAVIKKDLLQFPNVRHVAFNWPPPQLIRPYRRETRPPSGKRALAAMGAEPMGRSFLTRRWYDAG